MDVLDVLASGMFRSEGLGQGFLQFLELCGHRDSISCLTALLAIVVDALDISLMEMTL
jgi:hypothetical protein